MNNTDKNTVISAVSPLKRKKAYKGGTKIKSKATKTLKKHGGFGKSTATHNRPGYTASTRFRIPDKKTFPSSSSSSTPPAPTKPYSYGPNGGINFNPVINVAGTTVNNNPSFVNKNANANAGGTGETETTTTTENKGHWEHTKVEKKRDSEGGARNACNEARRTSKYFKDGKNKKGETFEEECNKYNKHVEEKGHGKKEYKTNSKWVDDGSKTSTTTKNTNKGSNATAIIYGDNN